MYFSYEIFAINFTGTTDNKNQSTENKKGDVPTLANQNKTSIGPTTPTEPAATYFSDFVAASCFAALASRLSTNRDFLAYSYCLTRFNC